jgi:ribonucleoside-diphosphate reductase alpha chain
MTVTHSAADHTTAAPGAGVRVERRFTEPSVHPFEAIEWEIRDAVIGDPAAPAFEQREVEFPASWSQNATNIVAQKYFRGQLGAAERERSVKQMVSRVAGTIARWGREGGYFAATEDGDAFEAELTHVLVNQMAAFNSPVWFNVGFEEQPQCSACQPYRALVSTPEGMVPIGELVESEQVGRVVYDANGTTRVIAVKANGRKRVFRGQLRNGQFIEATADHVVKAVRARGATPEWLRVDELRPGMRLHLHPHRAKVQQPALVPAGGVEPGESELSAEEALRTDEVEIAEAALAGWLQADGFVGQYMHGTNRSLTIEFQTATDEEHGWVLSHLEAALPDVHRCVREADTQETRVRRIRLYGEVLRAFVDKWELLARGTELRVPSRLWTASHDEITAYLTSVFQADGYVSVRRGGRYEAARIGFAVISERWTEDIQLLLNVIGIYSRRLRKHEKRANRHDLHEISIGIGSERARFAELVGFVGRDKQQKLIESLGLRGLRTCGDVREEEIVTIEDLGVEEVYDIQTESGEYLSNNIAVHNCFILSVEDTMESILEWNTKEGHIFRGGSGSGINLSKIRGSAEQLSKGGYASGPVSFMRGADAWAGTIKSGGKTRRAAKMVVLDVDHPDIVDFIWCKAREEEKALALREAGFDMSIDGEGFTSIQYQNANNSVRVTDEFMERAERGETWQTTARTTGEPIGEPLDARDLLRQIADAAWRCADPGVQYDTTINDWHTCPNSGRINASNPCSEYLHVDDSACNLASLNLMRFRRADGTIDVEAFEHVVDVVLLAQDIVVGPASYPTEEIGRNARAFRQLGLGYANLGALLMSNGLPYDSDRGRATAAAITALMTGRAYRRSAEAAAAMGPYERYAENREPHNYVMRKHRAAAYGIEPGSCDDGLLSAAQRAWDEAVSLGDAHGYRNAQCSVIAPTGTISFLMDCDTTGLEPDFSLVKFKELVGGGRMTIVNRTVPHALDTLGYAGEQIAQIEAHVNEHGSIVGAPGLKAEHLPVFDVAVGERSISPMGHIKMMGAIQPGVSGALSKTVNMPADTTVEDIADAYLQAWRLGVKALAIYRDGSKTAQALRTEAHDEKGAEEDVAEVVAEPRPFRRRMPRERHSITHKFSIGGHEGYITAGMYEDGSVGEIFLTDIGKEGSTLRGMMNSFATAISISLQYGVPLETLVRKFCYMRFEPEGMTQNTEIPFAKSMPDYIMRWLASRFLGVDVQEELGILTPEVRARKASQEALMRGDTAGPVGSEGGNGNGGSGGASNGGANQGGSAGATPGDTPPFAPAPGSRPASGSQPATTKAAAEAFTNTPPVMPARLHGLDLGPACAACGGMMQRTGSCYTCSSCGNNTGCG